MKLKAAKLLITIFLGSLYLMMANLAPVFAGDTFWFSWSQGYCDGTKPYVWLMWTPLSTTDANYYEIHQYSYYQAEQIYKLTPGQYTSSFTFDGKNYSYKDYNVVSGVDFYYKIFAYRNGTQYTTANGDGGGNPPKCTSSAPTVSFTKACLDGSGKATKVSISWASRTPAVISVDVTSNKNWPQDPTMDWKKDPKGALSVTAPDGFTPNDAAAIAAGPLTFTPGSTYFTSVWDGSVHSSPNTTFTIPKNLPSCNPTPTPTPGPPVTVSGKLYNKTTNQPVGVSQKVSTCGADASRDPTVSSDGSFNFQLQTGDLFCIRAPSVSGYNLDNGAAVNWVGTVPTGNPKINYELQVAGIDCVATPTNPSCQGGSNGISSKVNDRPVDSSYNVAYTPTLPPSQVLNKIEISENQLFPADSSTTVLNPPFNLNGDNQVLTEYQFRDPSPGIKSIWVRFTSDQGSVQVVGPISIELVQDDNGAGITYPRITTLTCSRDSSSNVNFTINGENLGQAAGTVTSGTQTLAIQGNWSESLVKVSYSNAPADQGSFDVALTRFDGRSTTSSCNLTTSQISLGASYFCPAIPNHTETNVGLALYDSTATSSSSAKLLEKQVTINSKGIIEGLDYQFSEGKNYTVSIKTAASLLRFGTFNATTSPGSTTVLNISLPVGDIYPTSGDGAINIFDRSELVRQWGVSQDVRPGDFNLDGTVNSFDWACMRYNFGETNDPIPSFPISQ